MGYTFRIGNAKPRSEKDEDTGSLRAWWEVDAATSPDAPTFPNDDMTGNSNSRSPSYSTWFDFCKATGIVGLFYDERGRMKEGHPGCQPITESDYLMVKHALDQWQLTATKPPGFEGFGKFDNEKQRWVSEDEGKYDYQLARLMWLAWWMRWALDNCETPAIQNT